MQQLDYYERLAVDELKKSGPLIGRELRQRINRRLSWFWRFTVGGFYYMMSRLEDRGIIDCRDLNDGCVTRREYWLIDEHHPKTGELDETL